MKHKKKPENNIAQNKKAHFDYFIETTYEAGIVLQGWEVKSCRDKRIQLKESYVIIENQALWLYGAHISPLPTVSTHYSPNATRSRKLLLHDYEIKRLIGSVERKGYTLVALSMYWKKGLAKINVGLGKGKKQHDKRATEKDRDWQRDKQRLFKDQKEH